jgi:Non-repetitive/WGA-negative nucleoporin C-terminal
MPALAPNLEDRPAFKQLLARLLKRLLQDKALSAEDLIDVQTLKQNLEDDVLDYFRALEVLRRSKVSREQVRRLDVNRDLTILCRISHLDALS